MKLRTLLSALLLVGLQSGQAESRTDTWRIGAMVCLSGGCAETGVNSLNGAKLAAAELNSSGGVLGRKIELVAEDTAEAASGAAAVTAFRKLRQDSSIRYFVGPSWTTGGLSIAPIAARMKDIIAVSPSLGVADYNEAGDNIFNVWPHDDAAVRGVAKFAVAKGWTRVAVFSSQQPWESLQGDVFAAEFPKLGGIITDKEEPLHTTTDLRAEALRIIRSQPQAVFLSNYNQMGIASKELRRSGFKGEIIAILMDDQRLAESAGALDGAFYASYPESAGDFIKNYSLRYGTKPGIAADTGYDTIQVLAAAVKTAGTFDVDKVRPEILKLKYKGASGELVFDEHGGVRKPFVIYQVKGKDRLVVGK